MSFDTKSVFVALVGRPNVGKSSLLNLLVGEKVAIVTSKPQTTRTRITGILTKGPVQYVFLDTPGIHLPRTKLGERMTKAAAESVAEVDVVAMLFEPYGELTEAEQKLVEEIRSRHARAVAVINKTDTLRQKADLAVREEFLKQLGVFKNGCAHFVKAEVFRDFAHRRFHILGFIAFRRKQIQRTLNCVGNQCHSIRPCCRKLSIR